MQHTKVYVFDDTVVLSGANLSNDYFTTRQDRYMVIRNAGLLADAMHSFVNSMCNNSFTVSGAVGDNTLVVPLHYDATQATFSRWLAQEFETDATAPATALIDCPARSSASAYVTPTVQFAAAGIRHDEHVTQDLLRSTSPLDSIRIASGYFNFPRALADVVVHETPARAVDILTASPAANGFFGASGIAGAIPLGYSEIERDFYKKCEAAHATHRIRLHEYTRPGWTYHSKGMWINCGGGPSPSSVLQGPERIAGVQKGRGWRLGM